MPAGSGSSWRAPQDVVSDEYMEQLKYTDAGSYRLTVVELLRLNRDALRAGKTPRMVIDFPHEDMRVTIYLEHIPH